MQAHIHRLQVAGYWKLGERYLSDPVFPQGRRGAEGFDLGELCELCERNLFDPVLTTTDGHGSTRMEGWDFGAGTPSCRPGLGDPGVLGERNLFDPVFSQRHKGTKGFDLGELCDLCERNLLDPVLTPRMNMD